MDRKIEKATGVTFYFATPPVRTCTPKSTALATVARAGARPVQRWLLCVDSQLDNLREDPRFKELVKKVGFPA